MIFVDRAGVSLPQILTGKLKNEEGNAEKFFIGKIERSQSRFNFNTKILQQVKESLETLFNGKCAYCESRISLVASTHVDHFRPKIEAINWDGGSSPDHYWWLAYEWENLYLVCPTCNLNKKTLFPVAGKRAKYPEKGTALRKERNLLIDPCIDNPDLHLKFSEDGSVKSISLDDFNTRKSFKGFDRGAITIEILGLNRPDLIDARSRRASLINALLEQLKNSAKTQAIIEFDEVIQQISKETRSNVTYAGMCRQLVADKLRDDGTLSNFIQHLPDSRKDEIYQELNINFIEKGKITKTKQPYKPRAVKLDYPDNVYVRSLEIRNFRAVRNLKIQFNEGINISSQESLTPSADSGIAEPNGVGWKMLLGENGAGKSSVLKALAIALLGEELYEVHRKDYGILPEQIFNKEAKQKNNKNGKQEKGYIRVELSKGEAIEIHFDDKELDFKSGKLGGKGYVRGYGSVRIFTPWDTFEEKEKDKLRERSNLLKDVTNLFLPKVDFIDPNDWLSNLKQILGTAKGREMFNSAGLTIGDLLDIDKKIVKKPLRKSGEIVYLNTGHSASLPLTDQSDGYNSVLTLATDIMAGLRTRDKKEATGIVLLDEIDAHLHPRWKMKIVKSLRKSFPYIQFIATTHEPLCLQGLVENEITIMKREGNKIMVQDNIPSPSGLRVDQLLTSELFGLGSTIDPDIDEKFQEYYQLLAKAESERTKDEQERMSNLEIELQRYNKLGFTRRDQMVYKLIDEFIAEQRFGTGQSKNLELDAKTKERIWEIWNLTKLREE